MDYVAADMHRMVARKNKTGMFKSAAVKALAAKKLDDAVQDGVQRVTYFSFHFCRVTALALHVSQVRPRLR